MPSAAIPGWRVIVSDAGRFWASRVEPFPEEAEWYAPPYRTVDGDTFEALQAEVERQEEAAGQLEAAPDESAEQTKTVPARAGQAADRTATPGGQAAVSGAASGRVEG
ncbi:hypothetical protein GCM10017673_13750 [Streptosporangium violaceochromogenes]|nr:hypothetical protein GCM10017673_13750 [Streptosporangium violaceochromogenes]